MSAQPAVVVHGGSEGTTAARAELDTAARAGLRQATAADALAATVAAVCALEDCGCFNAGRGADVRLDGERLELDASVMDSRGRLGAVAGLTRTRNPILAALAVSQTPHWLLAGPGADRFATQMGLAQDAVASAAALERQRQLLAELHRDERAQASPGHDNARFRELWNYPAGWSETVARHGCGTVGAVARDAAGGFAVATSTGGSAPCLWGRVGDSPIVGAGFYAGPRGAVGATGIGEAIVRQLLAIRVYQWLEQGLTLRHALQLGVDLFPKEISVGLIGITAHEAGFASNRDMPAATLNAA